jgi:hypothetical protein
MAFDENSLFPEDRDKARRSRIYGTPEFWQAYREYIQSPQWKKLCRAVRQRAKNRCERCPPYLPPARRLAVHHETYERFQNERLSDLELLCTPCHEAADRGRERRNKQAYEAAGEEAREAAWMNSFFTTKYGEDWWLHYGDDPEGMREEFDAWRERKRDENDYDY